MYRNLSLAFDGGIVDKSSLAEQSGDAVLFIGLGGTGQDCLRAIKKEIYHQIEPDKDSVSPLFKHFQFLMIDNDIPYDYETPVDAHNEFLNIVADLDCPTSIKRINSQVQLRWYNSIMPVFDDSHNPCATFAVRQRGRLSLFLSCDKTVIAIKKKIMSAIVGACRKNLYIHIFTSACGGTGSGCFLDICYILQYLLYQLKLTNVIISGYCFLPDVICSKVSSNSVKQHLMGNSFAFLKELDYCMNFDNNGGEWDQEYYGFKVKTTSRPVHNMFLIGSPENEEKNNYETYQKAVGTVADFIVNSLKNFETVYSRSNGPNIFLSLACQSPSYERLLPKNHGAAYRYHVIGGYRIYVPSREILTYVASRVWEKHEEMTKQIPNIETLIFEIGLDYNSLLKEIKNNADIIKEYEVDQIELYNQVQNIKPLEIPKLLAQMENRASVIPKHFASNKEKLIEKVTNNLKERLIDFLLDASKVPAYVSRLKRSYSLDEDLLTVIYGLITHNNYYAAEAKETAEIRKSELIKALNLYLNSYSFQRKSKASTYISAVRKYLTQIVEIQLYEEIGDFLERLKIEVEKLNQSIFVPFSKIIHRLEQTFSDNVNMLEKHGFKHSNYSKPLFEFEDAFFQDRIKKIIDEIDSDTFAAGLLSYLFNKLNYKFNDENEEIIEIEVLRYCYDKLKPNVDFSIKSYLSEKFDVKNGDELRQTLCQNILTAMKDASKPLVNIKESDFQYHVSELFEPNISDVLVRESKRMQEKNDFIINRMEKGFTNTIYWNQRFYCLALYELSELERYMSHYLGCYSPGRHLYERRKDC